MAVRVTKNAGDSKHGTFIMVNGFDASMMMSSPGKEDMRCEGHV
jgi:hypothetical protein